MKFTFAVLSLTLAVSAQAEIVKNALPCEDKMCFYWWPQLPAQKGWHQDEGSSYKYNFNAQAKDKETFSSGDTVFYAKANYKPKSPGIMSLDAFIEDDHKTFRKDSPETKIEVVSPVVDGDGKKLKTFRFTPKTSGNFEQVAYGEEGEYFLVFTLTAKSKMGLETNKSMMKSFVSRYKEKY
jgi:hypothetical protein